MARVNRRQAVQKIVAAAAGAGMMATAKAETEDTASDGAITPGDIAASDKIAGRTGTTDAERQQMAKTLESVREALEAVRTSPLTAGYAPAFQFEPRLPDTKIPTGKSGATLSRAPLPPWDGKMESLAFFSLADLSRLVKARKVSSLDLTQMYLARLKMFSPRLLCVVSLLEDAALREAKAADAEIAAGGYRGPLHGIPCGVKDLLDVEGTKTTFGAKPYQNQNSQGDSTVVARLRKAGAVLVAKFSMGELAMGDVWFGGTTRTPWNPQKGSSGSSAGSASAVAAGLVGFAIGTETLGSIISPSVACGTISLRPTFGRVSRHGAMALSWTMDKIGPMCRSAEDCALVFDAIHGPDGLDTTVSDTPFRWDSRSKLSDLRVGIDKRSFDALSERKNDKGTKKIYAAALAVLTETLGITLVPITLPESNPAYEALANLTIKVEGAAAFARLTADGGLRDLVQQDDWNWPNAFRVGATIPAADYVQAQRVRAHLQRAMADATSAVDVYVTVPLSGPSLTYTNLCGQPSAITRCGLNDDGLPVSVEFTGALYREDAALRLAYAFEQATDWHKQWPDTEKLPLTPPPLDK